MRLARILMALTLLAPATGCAVDYGKARWIFVDPSFPDGWYSAIEDASDVWQYQYGVTVKPTQEGGATEHAIVPILESQCEHVFQELHSPGSIFVDVGFDGCMGAAVFNGLTNVWKVGLVTDYWTHPRLDAEGKPYIYNYYDMVHLSAHEIGHVLGCDHTESLDKPGIMHYGFEPGNTRSSLIVTKNDLDVCPIW